MYSQVLNKIKKDYIEDRLKEMVKIPSVIGQEADLAEYLRDILSYMGFKTHLELVEAGRPNIIGVLENIRNAPLIMFNGHIDTVSICDGWTKDPYLPFIDDNKLVGLGSWDMKSGIACSLAALKALIEVEEPIGNLAFSGVIDEEGYSKGARAVLNTELKKSDAIIIGEPYFGDNEDNRIPIGITGKVLYEVEVHGQAFHGFHPELGINAIDDASQIVASLDQLELTPHPQFERGNVCTLKITGGYENYEVTVPDRCSIIITRLMVPGETKEGVLAGMRHYIDSLNLKSTVDINIIPPFYNPYEISRETPLMQCFSEAYQDIRGAPPIVGYRPGITDANVFMGEGQIPTINFGPRGGQYHGADEYVELDSLLDVAKIQTLTALNLFSKLSC